MPGTPNTSSRILILVPGITTSRSPSQRHAEKRELLTSRSMTCVTLGTRLADAGVDVVKIKELMGHASIVTTMRYIHATDRGKRGAIVVLSEYRQKHRHQDGHKLVTTAKRQAVQPAVSH